LSKTVDKEFQHYPKNGAVAASDNSSRPGGALTPCRVRVQGRNLRGRSQSDVVVAARLTMCRMSMRGEVSIERALFHDDFSQLVAAASAPAQRRRRTGLSLNVNWLLWLNGTYRSVGGPSFGRRAACAAVSNRSIKISASIAAILCLEPVLD
jgi:hypothetical protein